MTQQDEPIYCSRCNKAAGYSPQEVWHLWVDMRAATAQKKSKTKRKMTNE